jgi:hypothetical protein
MSLRLRHHLPELFLWSLISTFIVYLSWEQIVTRGGWDPDDQLRLVQLRDFLSGQSWFDNSQYRMNPPDGAPMHWSRLIELPLALIILVLAPLIGSAKAEMAAGIIVPLFGRAAGLSAFILTLMSPALLIQLRPMRIDHHGWQIFGATVALWALFEDNLRKSGLILGAALAIWIHVSLEGAPMTAAFFLLLGARWIGKREENMRLVWTLISFAASSLLLFLGTQANGFGAAQYCDTVSPAHIWAILAAIAVMLPALHLNPAHWGVRIAVSATAGLAAIALLLSLAPHCRDGAFGGLDPVIRQYWYIMVDEGLPVWHQDMANAFTLMTPLIVALVSLGFAWRFIDKAHRPALATLGYFLVYASLLSVFVFRTISVATMFTIVPAALCLAATLRRYTTEPILARRLLLVPAALMLLVSGIITGALVGAIQPKPAKAVTKREANVAKCESLQSVRALGKLPRGNIIGPFNIGPALLMTTRHKALASSHHRNVEGMRAQIDIFRLPPAQSRVIIDRHQINYVVACDREAEMMNYASSNPNGLWAKMYRGQVPDWLVEQAPVGHGLRVWRVQRPTP